MEIERRALYNLLRLNWIQDPSTRVEPWQVEDLRRVSLEELFERLKRLHIHLDRKSFVAYGDHYDTPEELMESLVLDEGTELPPQEQDKGYLVVFELWRRLLPEKPSVSIFCDELDYHIHLYDQGELHTIQPLQDALANLQNLLEENLDQGADPIVLFDSISQYCANDIESFLYDFIADQIDLENYVYAREMIEGFYDFVKEVCWFDFLKARLFSLSDIKAANELISSLIHHAKLDLELSLEMLSFMVQGGELDLFAHLLQKTLPLLQIEEDFQDLLSIAADFFRCLDQEDKEAAILQILELRKNRSKEADLDQYDADMTKLIKIVTSPQVKPA